ncbi:MAG TPA: cell division protein SepF [Rubrobacteraceae bacterium]|nr:cell division protein SepF [Rubrobacteraceae bacterium]
MGVRDQLDRVAAWFGFGVEDDDFYEDEEEETGRYGAYSNGSRGAAEPGPAVRRLGRAERSSAFGTSLGDLFGSEGPSREKYSNQSQSSHLRAVPDHSPAPARVSVLEPSSFNDAQALADRFKRQQPVILNLQNVDGDLSRRMVDFCAGLTYALDGNIQTVANRVFLLTPRNVEVSAEERKRLAERAFFNQL